MKSILIVPFVALIAAGCGEIDRVVVKGSGTVKTEKRQVQAFDAITINGAVQLDVRRAGGTKLEITTDDNLMALVETKVNGRELVIETKSGYQSSKGLIIRVETPALRRLTINGAGRASVVGIFDDRFDMVINGSSDITLSGRVGRLDATINGSGTIRAFELRAAQINATIRGSGAGEFFATGAIDAEVMGSGRITHDGPGTVSTNVMGSGSVRRR